MALHLLKIKKEHRNDALNKVPWPFSSFLINKYFSTSLNTDLTPIDEQLTDNPHIL